VIWSCPVELPTRMGWLKSGRFLRLLSALTALAVLAAILYNATIVDRVPPTFSIHVISTSAGGQALTLTAIDVDFSKEVNRTTAEAAFSITPNTQGSFHWQGLKLIWTPSTKLPLSTDFKVHMASGVQDLAGNVQGGTADLKFTTVGAPTVTAVSPPADQPAPVDAPIQITFDRPMDPQNVVAGLKVSPSFSYEVSWKGPVLTLTPTGPLQYGTEYTLTIGDPAVDTDGNQLLPDYVTTFTTVSIGLRVTALIPAPKVAGVSVHSQIAVIFDGPVDPATVADAISITPPVSGSTKVATLPDDRTAPAAPTAAPSASAVPTPTGPTNNVLLFTPNSPLAANTTYSVTTSTTVRRVGGQASPQQAWTFTTGEPPVNALNQIAFISDHGGIANVWLMNPDGTSQREVTSELVPVSGFDVSGDGSTIAYGAGGVVKKMSISGDAQQTLTAAGSMEYAPTFTPDGTGLIVGRRDATGADQGYWRIPLISGTDPRQVTPDGAPNLGSTSISGDGLTSKPSPTGWGPRAAFSQDGKSMLVVRGSDGGVVLVDMSGANPPRTINLVGDSRPVWVQNDSAFYVAASADHGTTWADWRVTPDGAVTNVGPAEGDIDTSGDGALTFLVSATGDVTHVAYASSSTRVLTLLTNNPAYSETSPSFSPDGHMVVFGRVSADSPTISAGIWIVKPDGSGLTNLATDGAYPRWLP
jgi:hypothetical protein